MSSTFEPIRSAHLEAIVKQFKDPTGKPIMPGMRYVFPFTVQGKTMFGCLDAEQKETGRKMCIICAGVNPIEDCDALKGDKVQFPYPPDVKVLGPGWWSVSVYCDDSVPDDLFDKRLRSAIELLQNKAARYMATSGFDEDWRAEQDGIVWRVAVEKDLPALLEAHHAAHSHVNGGKHPHPLKPPVILTLVAEKDGAILGGMYVEAIAEVTMIGTNADAFATLPALDHDVRAFLAHRAFRVVQTRVIPEAAAAMARTHAALGFTADTFGVLRQRV